MKKLLFVTMLLTLTATQSFSVNISWDGGGDNVTWTDALNWDCNCLPAAADVVTILAMGSSVTIPTGATVHINRLNSYQNVTIATGAALRVDYIIYLVFSGTFINNGTINFFGEALEVRDEHHFINNGTINMQVAYNEIYMYGNNTNPCTFINHGQIHYNVLDFAYLRTTTNSIFTNAATGTITFLHANQAINLNGGTVYNHGLISGKGKIYNASTFINEGTGIIDITQYNTNAINNLGVFQNQGEINVSNPAPGALHSFNNSGTYTGNGSINFAGNDLVHNSGTCTISGPANLAGDQYYGGIYNSGSLTFNNVDWILDISGKMWNTVTGTLTIASCKKLKNTGTFENQGTLNNFGYLELVGSGPYAYSSTGLFTNSVVYSSNFDTPIDEPTGNSGLHLPKIFGQQCAGTPIVFFYSGTLNGITNTPAGIFTTSGLTTSAGSFDYLTRTFTPNAACHDLTTLYVSFQMSGCDAITLPMNFELPIYAPTTYYEDADFDGFGNLAMSQLVECAAAPIGYVTNSTDCNDNNPDVYPGAPETCNDKDYNCDGMITGTNPAPTWYQDLDADGYGNPSISIVNCYPIFGYVGNNSDCNDTNGQVYPTAVEQCNNIDDDCDGLIDEGIVTTLVTFNGSINNDWFNSGNWTPAIIPSVCIDVLIPAALTVQIIGGQALCRSMSVENNAVFNFLGGQLTVSGGTSFGIHNMGTMNISGNSSANITYINGNGLQNSGTINISDDAFLFLNTISMSCVQNTSAGTITITGNNIFLDLSSALNGIMNAGTFVRNGYTNINQITGSAIVNAGTFTNNGNLFANAFGLPGWYIENLTGGIFNNQVGQTIAFPIPGILYNVSDMGILNHPGATFHNYGELHFFGHRIAGSGAFIQYAGSAVEGCDPSMGCLP